MRVSLSRQIVISASIGLVLFTAALWLSVISIGNQMDRKAFSDSLKLMQQSIASSQEQVRIIASDYNNWNDVHEAAMRGDIDAIASNYGITAARGDVFQYAVMMDGPFATPVAWVYGKGLIPQENFLPPDVTQAIRRAVGGLVYDRRETFDFFCVLRGEIVMFSASHLLPEDLGRLRQRVPAQIPLAAIGKILAPAKLAQIQEELAVTSLHLTTREPEGGTSLPLAGANAAPVAWLVWDHPRPGTKLFEKMVPILIGVTLAFAGLTLLATRLIHTQACALMRKEAEAADLARTDSLTGLPNRLALLERLDSLHCREMAILAIDLDRFKQVNDVVGHGGGDIYLTSFARRLARLRDPNCFVARIGGDEFVAVLHAELNLRAVAAAKVAALRTILAEPILHAGFSFDVAASQGLAFCFDGSTSPAELLGKADRAMYHAKVQRLQEVVLYDAEMEARDEARSTIERALRAALAGGQEFTLAYQPIVAAGDTCRMIRAEALLRWSSPLLGQVSPADFIPVAERSGLIFPLGWAVVDMVCRDLAAYPDLTVAINVSPLQLTAPRFAETLIEKVARWSIDHHRIEIEVTENVAIQNDDVVTKELHLLRAAGFSIALDDFGTGFSSIAYLGRMPLDVIKIDRSFVSGDPGRTGRFCMIHSIISLAHSMGLSVVAEGVERDDELSRLIQNGCDQVQGYLTGRPGDLATLASRFGLARGPAPGAPDEAGAEPPAGLLTRAAS